jgi:hypothetical protein
MQFRDLVAQLTRRHVFRAAAIYAATAWVVLQAADVFAGEGIVSEELVGWLIIAAVIGLPLVLLGSWFIEAPWKARSKVATAGDLFIISAIGAGALLFAWQQWFMSSVHVPVAVGRIEATDLQEETRALAAHLEARFTELFDAKETAELRFAGTLVRGGDRLRLTARLEDLDANILWTDSFEQALVDLGALQFAAIDALAEDVASLRPRRDAARRIVEGCPYPDSAAAIVALATAGNPEALAAHIDTNADNGLLLLEQSLRWFSALKAAPPPEKPVLFALAMQSLDGAAMTCPGYARIEEMRVTYTRLETP